MRMILLVILALVVVKCIANKISVLALLLYMEEHGKVPDEAEIKVYTNRAAKKLFHMPS